MPFSPTLLFEPTPTKSVSPSALAIRLLVQWWLIVPPGSIVTGAGGAVICVAPVEYGTLTSASALATYSVSPASAIPNGERSPDRKVDRMSATPSPSVSRRRVMRSALGTPPPAFFWNRLKKYPFTPLLSSGRTGAFVSATSTSPLGSTQSQRGCIRLVANAATARPFAALGFPPGGQPFAVTMFIVGSSE